MIQRLKLLDLDTIMERAQYMDFKEVIISIAQDHFCQISAFFVWEWLTNFN